MKTTDEIMYFEYGEKELDYLRTRDAALGRAIDEIGHIRREVIPDMFRALINAIIGQQISSKAKKTVWQRFQVMFEPITPEHIAVLPVEQLQQCGISMRRASCIKEIATGISRGSLNLSELSAMSDDKVAEKLCRLKGVGVWTAEMLMIFSMQRKDILSRNDKAILRGLRMLYRHKEITPKLFERYKKRYSPYASIASLYLWRISHGDYIARANRESKKEII